MTNLMPEINQKYVDYEKKCVEGLSLVFFQSFDLKKARKLLNLGGNLSQHRPTFTFYFFQKKYLHRFFSDKFSKCNVFSKHFNKKSLSHHKVWGYKAIVLLVDFAEVW